MINSNDLRVGNQVLHKGVVIIIDGIDKSNEYTMVEDKHISTPLVEIEPITLTPEWLRRCGLSNRYWNTDKDLKLEIYENNAYIGNNFSTSATIIHNINYVHQLQNLYFALTGEELTIKETV